MTGMNNHRNFVRAKALHESQITFGDLSKKRAIRRALRVNGNNPEELEKFRGKTTWINLAGMKFIV